MLALAAIVVVTRDGVDRRATREQFANLVDVRRDTTEPGTVALVLTNMGEHPVFLRSVLLWVDLAVQPRDLLVERSLVTTRWPWLIGRAQLRIEVRPQEPGSAAFEVLPKQSRRVSVALQRLGYETHVLLAGVAFVDSAGRTYTRRPDGKVLSGERVSARLRRRFRIGDPIT